MKIGSINQRQQLGRKVQGIAAALLPFKRMGELRSKPFKIICVPRMAPD